MAELVPVVRDLARQAAKAGMGLNIDAEEADRLGLSLKVIDAVLADPELSGWDGFGVVVQDYGRRAPDVIDGVHEMARRFDRRIMVRLVKGAYWHAQVEGLDDFPVFTRKAATDVSYLGNARKLLSLTDRIYPQFATHNAHTVAAVLEMAGGLDPLDLRVPASARDGRSAARHSGCGRRHALPHLRAGRRAPRPARLSCPPVAGERRQLLLRQPDRRCGRAGACRRGVPVRDTGAGPGPL